MNRTPPLGVRRELRREVGFGCPVDGCGSPYLTWHHFDPPWNEHQHHDVPRMVALCREHHDKADAGAFTREQLRQLKTKRADRVAGRFDWMRQDLLLVVGGNFYYRTPVPVQFRGDPVVSTTRDEEGQLLVSLGMLTTSSEPRLRMMENFWISEGRPSDLECPPNGRRIAVAYGNGDLLSIEFSDVSEPAELGTRYPDASPERWQLTYPVTTVEVRMRVGGTQLEFGPTQTTLPGNNMMRGCFAADCAVGLGFGQLALEQSPVAITYLVEDFTGGSADTDGEISLALDRVLDHLAETAGSALEKARKGEDWQEEVDRVGSHEMIASGAD